MHRPTPEASRIANKDGIGQCQTARGALHRPTATASRVFVECDAGQHKIAIAVIAPPLLTVVLPLKVTLISVGLLVVTVNRPAIAAGRRVAVENNVS